MPDHPPEKYCSLLWTNSPGTDPRSPHRTWPNVWEIDMENIVDNLNLSKKRGKGGRDPFKPEQLQSRPVGVLGRLPSSPQPCCGAARPAVAGWYRTAQLAGLRRPAQEGHPPGLTRLGSWHLGARRGGLLRNRSSCSASVVLLLSVNFQSVFVVPRA